MIKKSLFALLIGSFFCLGVVGLKAQANKDQLQQDFTYQYDKYRVAYEEFQLKKNQYIESESIAAQEELTVAAKDMLLARASTYLVHWQILESNLFDVVAFSPKIIEPLVNEAKQRQVEVSNHYEIVSKLDSYQEMGSVAQAFNNQSKFYDSLTYKSAAGVLLGRFKRSLEAETRLLSRLESEIPIQIRDTAKAQTKQRGLVTVDQLIQEAAAGYEEVNTQATKFSDDGFNQSDRFNRLVDDMQKPYESLLLAHQLLEELAQGLE